MVLEDEAKNNEKKKTTTMSSYAKFLKEMLSKKRKIEENVTVSLTAECSAVFQNNLPQKLGNPGSYYIPIKLSDIAIV